MSLDPEIRRDDLDGLEDDETQVEDPEIRRAKLVLTLATIVVLSVITIVLVILFRPEGQVITTSWPNGYTRTATTYVRGTRHDDAPPSPSTERPRIVEQGTHRAWHENGQLAEEGRYEMGFREGKWRFWNEAGELDRERSGTFSWGKRN